MPKQYLSIAGRSLIGHTLAALDAVPDLATTLVVIAPDDVGFAAAMWGADDHADQGAPKSVRRTASGSADLWVERCGGTTRAASVAAGLDALIGHGAHGDDWVLVHDAARCLVRPEWVQRLIDACRNDAVGGLLALPLADTLKASSLSTNNLPRVASTIDRSHKWLAQTPQMFRIGLLRRALAEAGPGVTDEASAIEAIGHEPLLVEGAMENFKLTYPADFDLAERLLTSRVASPGASQLHALNPHR